MLKSWEETRQVLVALQKENCFAMELDYLRCLSLGTAGAGEVVEIGTNIGQSTVALAYGQKEKGGRQVHTVDIFKHADSAGNFQNADVADFVVPIVETSAVAALAWNKPIELLWIDGDHSYLGVRADILAWSRFVVKGGWVAFHDYPGMDGSIEVWRAIHDELTSRPHTWRVVRDREKGDRILVLERLQSEPADGASAEPRSRGLYWLYRDLRTWVFERFPGLSKLLVGQLMRLKNWLQLERGRK